MKGLQDRKRALVAESEVYRQTLRLEVQNIRLYAVRMQRKFALVRLANPLFLIAGSFIGSKILGRKSRLRKRRRLSWLGMAMMGWKLFKNYGPMLQNMLAQSLMARRQSPRSAAEERTPAANI